MLDFAHAFAYLRKVGPTFGRLEVQIVEIEFMVTLNSGLLLREITVLQ